MEPDDNNELTRSLEEALPLAAKVVDMHPVVLRHLLRAPLYFLMPPHPEMEGSVELPLSDTPPFIMFKNVKKDRHEVPLFTSMARFDEFQATKKEPKSYAVACGDGRTILALIAREGKPIVINPASLTTKSLFMPASMLVELLEGKLLKPLPIYPARHPKRKPGTLAQLQGCSPDRVPPEFLNPVVEFMQRNSEFVAAWLVDEIIPDQPTKARLHFVIETRGKAEYIEENFGFIVRYLACRHLDCVVDKLDRKTPDGKILIEKQQPFYPVPKPPKTPRKNTRKR